MTHFSRIIVVSRSDFLSSSLFDFSIRFDCQIASPSSMPSLVCGGHQATILVPFLRCPGSVHPPFCVVTSQTLLLLTVPSCETEALAYSIPHALPSKCLRARPRVYPKVPEPYLPLPSLDSPSTVPTATNRVLSVCPSDYSISDTYLPRCVVVYTHTHST